MVWGFSGSLLSGRVWKSNKQFYSAVLCNQVPLALHMVCQTKGFTSERVCLSFADVRHSSSSFGKKEYSAAAFVMT